MSYVKDVAWKDAEAEKKILPIFANEKIFGVNLAKAGLLHPVCSCFKELIEGEGAVRKTLQKYVEEN